MKLFIRQTLACRSPVKMPPVEKRAAINHQKPAGIVPWEQRLDDDGFARLCIQDTAKIALQFRPVFALVTMGRLIVHVRDFRKR
jgi:hypothetical protein